MTTTTKECTGISLDKLMLAVKLQAANEVIVMKANGQAVDYRIFARDGEILRSAQQKLQAAEMAGFVEEYASETGIPVTTVNKETFPWLFR